MHFPSKLARLLVSAMLAACGAPDVDPRVPSTWMHTLYGAVRAERVSPPVASRIFAYAGTAMYSGFAATNPKLESPAGKLAGLVELPRGEAGQTFDPGYTSLQAVRTVLDSLFSDGLPTTRASIARLADSLAAARVKQGIAEDIRAKSSDLGHRIGLAIIAWSRTDGFDSTRGRKYVPPKGLGLWINDSPTSTYATRSMSATSEFIATDNPANAMRPGTATDRDLILGRPKRGGPTLPAANMAGVTEPYWWQVRPMVLDTWNACAVPPAPPYSADTGSVLYKDAKGVFETVNGLTKEQRTTALYWADNPGETGTPAGHWLAIASQMVSEKGLSAEEGARLMMLTGVTIHDAFIASWGYKFQLNTLRPRPYIRAQMDSAWEPAIPTPPFPEHPSGHSTMSAAAATTLTAFLGDVPFVDSTAISIGHQIRQFPSFRAAAEEAGMSRIYAGIHFMYGNLGGQALGKCVGGKVVEKFQVYGRSR
jgi:hypothetical protein